jgi:hypothetical protein
MAPKSNQEPVMPSFETLENHLRALRAARTDAANRGQIALQFRLAEDSYRVWRSLEELKRFYAAR